MRYSTVAIVEDDPHMARYLQGILQSHYVCWWFDSAQALLDFLQHHTSPDVILSDYLMPQMDGLELLQHINSTEMKIPFVLITAFLDRAVRQQAYQLGAFDLVTKPVAAEELRYRIEKAAGFAAYVKAYETLVRQEAQRYQVLLQLERRVGKEVAQQLVRRFIDPLQHFCFVGAPGTGKRFLARYFHYRDAGARHRILPLIEIAPEDFPSLEAFRSQMIGSVKEIGDRTLLFPGAWLRMAAGTVVVHQIDRFPVEIQELIFDIIRDNQLPIKRQTYPLGARIILLSDNPAFTVPKDLQTKVIVVRFKEFRELDGEIGNVAEEWLAAMNVGKHLMPATQQQLQKHHWRGNWREFKHALWKAVAASGERQHILVEDFLLADTEIQEGTVAEDVFQVPAGISIEELRYRYINFVKQRFSHLTRQQIAEMLGISRKTLWMLEKSEREKEQRKGSQ